MDSELKHQQRYYCRREFREREEAPGLSFPQSSHGILLGSGPWTEGETLLMHYILLTFPSTAILWGAYSNEVRVWFDRYFPVPNQRHGKAEEGTASFARKTRSSHWKTSYPGTSPLETLRRKAGERSDWANETLEKLEADDLCRVTFPVRREVSVCFTALCPAGLFCPIGNGSGCKAGWDQFQAWVLIWWLWISLFFLFCFFGTLIHTSDLLWVNSFSQFGELLYIVLIFIALF